jgi:hypothetical protein
VIARPFLDCLGPGALALSVAIGCEKSAPAERSEHDQREPPRAGTPVVPRELMPPPRAAPPAGQAAAAPSGPAPPHAGPWFAVTSTAAGVYSEPSFDRTKKIGYIRSGGRVPVEGEPVSKQNCSSGWYRVLSGGFVCGNLGTTDLSHPDVRFATAAPNTKEILPYPYARNAKNGTPLYKTVPSREQMERYEPYLKKDEPAAETDSKAAARATSPAASSAPAAAPPTASSAGAAVGAVAAAALSENAALALITESPTVEAEPEKPWWQREDIKERLHEVKLEHLEADSDEILAKRMVTGFYVAVDKTFRWNDRLWYKTTKGLVTPSDRFWQTKGSTFQGVELDGTTRRLPIAWVYGGRKAAATYQIDAAAGTITTSKSIERFVPIQLTGKMLDFRGTSYVELEGGGYMKKSQLRVTEPGPPPAGLAEGERYVDVDLSSQTLVVFEGMRPVYATLISSGKSSKDKAKDHSTPTGEWRVREKHITTTMDGDGTAAGDLPYSIEDVPYAMYYHKAYAVHAAFWHSNFGVQMSHGCVNLAPLDAKWIFQFTGPQVPEGFHGVWSTPPESGTRIVVHD